MNDFLRSLGIVAALLQAPGVQAAELTSDTLNEMDDCLVESATGRDVANTTIVCFNVARTACGADVLGCEAAMAEALTGRADTLLDRMPGELEGVPDFAKDRYKEILLDIDAGAVRLCADVPEAGRVSCQYRAQALRFAKLRSLSSQIDPRFLIP